MQRPPPNPSQNFDKLLRNFRNKMKRTNKMDDMRKKQYFEKPAEKKQRLINAAKQRETRRLKENQLKPLKRWHF
jgi:ribosomal protein S21